MQLLRSNGRTAGAIESAIEMDTARSVAKQAIYLPNAELDVIALTVAATHIQNSLNTAPYLLVTSDQGESGKSTVTNVIKYMSANPVKMSGSTTRDAFRNIYIKADQQGYTPTRIVEEISKIFGESGMNGKQHAMYEPLCEGYTRQGTPMIFGNQRMPVEISPFGVSVLSGLGSAVPPDLRKRCIPINMKPAPKGTQLTYSGRPDYIRKAEQAGRAVGAWARRNAPQIATVADSYWDNPPHPEFHARKAETWGPLFAIAEVAGGDWYDRCLKAFEKLATPVSSEPEYATDEHRVMSDIAGWVAENPEAERMYTDEIFAHLRSIDNRNYSAKNNWLGREVTQALELASKPDGQGGRYWLVAEFADAVTQIRDYYHNAAEKEIAEESGEEDFDGTWLSAYRHISKQRRKT